MPPKKSTPEDRNTPRRSGRSEAKPPSDKSGTDVKSPTESSRAGTPEVADEEGEPLDEFVQFYTQYQARVAAGETQPGDAQKFKFAREKLEEHFQNVSQSENESSGKETVQKQPRLPPSQPAKKIVGKDILHKTVRPKPKAKPHRPTRFAKPINTLAGITKPAIRRMARRGGVKRISGLIYDEIRNVTKKYLQDLLRLSTTYTEHRKAKTVTALDVVYALRIKGERLYGFGS
ncbi:hypothetical protein SARC_03374 [Sphaeroforma arctica JP610]|uniref:Histone H4 n=1 Tax=Sphaeroforma arctica JP610 TaxID=667725 RepID=A0A0L0G5V5_9EUKA|nr:hypothetical protein SARC_03374 [Sphaeroforma arctica JP610]KNC84412.1 hypothetical protein SARC_03374 [Sphaeroforma arctica JP610]|eukprot:XP_014158314.1 hypothetical protein SARC_03374 [Sphaeroforma arctica JP610]